MRGVVPQHLKTRFDALGELPPMAEAPEPWRQLGIRTVGGLTGIGFAESSDLLLVTSSAGRGVFDCRTGAVVARDGDDQFDFDIGNLLVEGIGPLASTRIRMSGLQGGGLPRRTTDGWGIEALPLSWPDEELILSPPGQTMLWSPPGTPMAAWKLAGFTSQVRAFGFSPTGQCLVVATAADITIFER
jgi:hypothetical protein